VTDIPNGTEQTYIEFTYDLRGTGREHEFVCVHGHHRHLHGAVMRKGQARFLVGWICAETIYGEDLAKYVADFDSAVQRRAALIRAKELRDAFAQFSSWAIQIPESSTLEAFETVRGQLKRRLPWVFELVRSGAGHRLNGATMPRYLCADGEDIEGAFIRLLDEITAATISLTGNAQRIANSIGSIRANIEGIVRRAELVLAKFQTLNCCFSPPR
jgi:hypothetical protein